MSSQSFIDLSTPAEVVASARPFDLNIERVLEHWTVAHAIREIIANALDEHMLTMTVEPQISKDATGTWHIRDFGRGLHYRHLTQNESQEKLVHADRLIGKFGVGLKDALATFDRRQIGVRIASRYGDITIDTAPKHGFQDIETLHALIAPPSDPTIVGTDVALTGVSDRDVEEAKRFFLRHAGERTLEETSHGDVLERSGPTARIYVNGLKVAEEDRFLFSYNVTKLSEPLRRALNRERSNVGRGAYAERVKAILLSCRTAAVVNVLAADLREFGRGGTHDELRWSDVEVLASKALNMSGDVVFATAEEMYRKGNVVDYAHAEGKQLIPVTSTLAERLKRETDLAGQPIRDIETYHREWERGFSFRFVDPAALNPNERRVFDCTEQIVALTNVARRYFRQVLISETMRPDPSGFEAAGLWEPADRTIIIKRSELRSLSNYAGVLLHELAHAATGTHDRTVEFETALTELLGVIAARMLS